MCNGSSRQINWNLNQIQGGMTDHGASLILTWVPFTVGKSMRAQKFLTHFWKKCAKIWMISARTRISLRKLPSVRVFWSHKDCKMPKNTRMEGKGQCASASASTIRIGLKIPPPYAYYYELRMVHLQKNVLLLQTPMPCPLARS